VVAETLNSKGSGQVSISFDTIVDFPDPDGPEMMINRPCFASWASFDILNKLPDLLDDRLDRYDSVGDRRVIGLGSNRIGFASDLLGEKIEPSALGFLLLDGVKELIQMAPEPDDLLT
jgi:hypothetical protein